MSTNVDTFHAQGKYVFSTLFENIMQETWDMFSDMYVLLRIIFDLIIFELISKKY